jgi:hypothetical protein
MRLVNIVLLIPLTYIYMTAHFPALAQTHQCNVTGQYCFIDTPNIHIHARSLSWFAPDTSV